MSFRALPILALALLLFAAFPPAAPAAAETPAEEEGGAWLMERLSPPLRTFYRDVAWKPDGSYALIVGGLRGPSHNPCSGWSLVLKYDGRDWEVLRNETGCMLYKVSWHPDGSHALMVGERDTILKFNGTGFKNIWALSGYAAAGDHFSPRSVAYRPDGKYALITGNDLLRFYPYDSTGRTVDLLYPGSHDTGNFYDAVAWSPDSRYAILEGGVTQNGTQALGVVIFFADDVELCAKQGSQKPCLYRRVLYGRFDPGFTDIDGIVFSPLGRAAWIHGYDKGKGTILRYGEDDDRFAYELYTHEGRLTSAGWQPGSNKILWTGTGSTPAVSSEVFRFDPVLTNAECASLFKTRPCPALKGVAWHPGGKFALVIGGSGYAFRFSPRLTPTTTIDAPRENQAVPSHEDLEVRGRAKAQLDGRRITDVLYRVDGGEWSPATVTGSGTQAGWNFTLPIAPLETGARHTIDVRASDDHGATWGPVATVPFFKQDLTRTFPAPVLTAPDGTTVKNGFNLSWTSTPGAYYVLQASRTATFVEVESSTRTENTIAFESYSAGTHHFRVLARGGLTDSPWSNVVTITVLEGPTLYDPVTGEVIARPTNDTNEPPDRTIIDDGKANTTGNPPPKPADPWWRKVPAAPPAWAALAAAGASIVVAATGRRPR